MASTNLVIIAGNLTRQPDVRMTNSGTAVGTLGVALNKKWRDQSGQPREDTVFVDVKVWGKQAEFCRDYLGKGASVLIEGELTMETWEDKATGKPRSKMLVKARNVQSLTPRQQQQQQQAPAPPPFPSAPEDQGYGGQSVDDIPY